MLVSIFMVMFDACVQYKCVYVGNYFDLHGEFRLFFVDVPISE